MTKISSESSPIYGELKHEATIIQEAKNILEARLHKTPVMCDPQTVKDFFIMHNAELEREVFSVMFLTTKHQWISVEQLFCGTIDGASVHPREVLKAALAANAAAVIFSHNHPSGNTALSMADKTITNKLVEALKLIDIRVLDHIVTAGDSAVSFADQGLL